MAQTNLKKGSSTTDHISNVVKVAVATGPKNASASTQAAAAAAAVRADPVVANKLNEEPFYQSRVGLGSIFALLSQVIPWVTPLLGFDPAVVSDTVSDVGTVIGIVYALYGRFWPRLKPLGRGGEPSAA